MPLEYKPRGKPRITAFKEFRLGGGEIIGVFQGSYGKRPELDILVKFRDKYTNPNRVRTPQHIHWVIDLLLKKEHNKELTLAFIAYLLNLAF